VSYHVTVSGFICFLLAEPYVPLSVTTCLYYKQQLPVAGLCTKCNNGQTLPELLRVLLWVSCFAAIKVRSFLYTTK
jgi:hypothetical protein